MYHLYIYTLLKLLFIAKKKTVLGYKISFEISNYINILHQTTVDKNALKINTKSHLFSVLIF